MPEFRQTESRSLSSTWIAALALALLVTILWLPFGLNVGFTGDDWIYFHQADAGSLMSSASPLRLFLPIPWLLAYSLTPGHFAGINLFLGLLIFGKSGLIYLILRRLNVASALAFVAAALAILIPADTGIFYMGALAIHFALFAYLLAFLLLLIYGTRKRLSTLLAMWIALTLSVSIYEAVYPLILFTPLALLLQRRFDRRFITMTLLWYLVPALNAVWYVAIILNFPRAFQYQSDVIRSFSLPAILTSLVNIYARHFFTGWVTFIGSPSAQVLLLSAVAGGIVFGTSWLLLRRESLTASRRLAALFMFSGLVLIGLGVALYLPTAVRDDTVRTYYFSSVGAALALMALAWWIAPRPVVFAGLIGLLAGLGMLHLLLQHRYYAEDAERQEMLIAELVRALPGPTPDTGLVIVDETPDRNFLKVIHGSIYVGYILPLVYGDYSISAEICSPSEFGTGDQARCRFTDEGIVIPSLRTRFFVHPYSQLIFLRYDGTFSVVHDLAPYHGSSVTDYRPDLLYDPVSAFPSRIENLFGL